MLAIDPATLTERETYKLLIGSIIPRPIAFVTSLSDSGVLNAAPFSYFNIVSSEPPLLSLSVQRKAGKAKDTARNILTTKEFVVHIVHESNISDVNKTSAPLLPDENELELTHFTTIASTSVQVPGVKEAKVRFECTLEHALLLGDSAVPSTDLLIGRIVHIHIAEKIYQEGKIDPRQLGAVSRLAGHNYARIGDIFELKRPTP